jgi:amylosucrase
MDVDKESRKTLKRLFAEIDLSELSKADQKLITSRLETNFPAMFALLHQVYGDQYDFFYYLQQLMMILKNGFVKRKPALKKKDKLRLKTPTWFADENILGMACYVDLFAGDLKQLQDNIPYLTSLGVTYLHVMPLYKSPEGDSDGGYAVSDYRTVDVRLGNIKDLEALAEALSKAGINLVLDFVFNHTSDEHEWALKAKQGEQDYQDYYWMFDSQDEPLQYEQHLREIFPQVRKGNFTYDQQALKWVWTTFNNFQWDLNYSNPAVFNAIVDEMLFLANLGCDALRLDALAFIWKELGTSCENQPKAHLLIQAFNRCLKIVSPAVVFKSEAIVHPDEVLKYIDKDECELSYNPLLMALIWNSLATRKTKLLTRSMQKCFGISGDCAWVNYARCHDDIGWTFDDGVAGELGINSHDHRDFLNQFYTGRFDGSFSKGVAFAENKVTGDCRVCGSLASLAGLEVALEKNDPMLLEHAVKRILLIHSIILSIGGIPLLYSGDELGLLNDYGYRNDPAKVHDDRWVNRIAVHDADVARTEDASTPFYEIASGLQKMIKARQQHSVFGASATTILETGNEHVFAYKREVPLADKSENNKLIALCNFSENEQVVQSKHIVAGKVLSATDLITQVDYIPAPLQINLAPYQVMWLVFKG